MLLEIGFTAYHVPDKGVRDDEAMDQAQVLYWAGLTGVLSALATGLGAIPVALTPRDGSRVARAFAGAAAAGMMISASVFSLAQEGIELERTQGRPSAPYEVIAGLLLGALFFKVAQSYVESKEWGDPDKPGNHRGFLLFLAMFIHSIPEGIAIGVGFATGDFRFGLVMALAISVHNIPEGIAISLPLRAEGASIWRCMGLSVLSSVPQPLLAVPAAYAVWLFQPLLAVGLGIAGGAMLYITMDELIPEALEDGGRTLTSWGVMAGLCGMLLVTTLLDHMKVAG